MLIGMDIITMGDFYISNYHGQTTMTFRVPSLECRDFTKEIKELQKLRAIHQAQSRQGNNKCPCKSGKNWDQCHGKAIKNLYKMIQDA